MVFKQEHRDPERAAALHLQRRQSRRSLGKRLLDTFYPDQELPYRSALLNAASPRSRALEIGAGSGGPHSPLRGRVECVVGIDLEPAVGSNPNLDAGVVANASCLPFPDGSFDIVFHRMVAEHFEEPSAAMRECARVLAPGGTLVFLTPNLWYYPMIVSAVTNTWFHRRWIGSVHGRAEHRVFPTFYRANTRGAVAKLLRDAGLEGRSSMLQTRPSYLSFFLPLLVLGIVWGQVVERLIPALRGRILVEATRPGRLGDAPRPAEKRSGHGLTTPSRVSGEENAVNPEQDR